MTFLQLFAPSANMEVQTHDFLNNSGSKEEGEASSDALGLDLGLERF